MSGAAPGPAGGAAPDLRRLDKEDGEGRLVAWLRGLAGAALRVPPVRVAADRPLSELGLDSLAAVELSHAVETELGLELGMARLLEGPSLAEVAAELWARREEARPVTGSPDGGAEPAPTRAEASSAPTLKTPSSALKPESASLAGGTTSGESARRETAADFGLTYGQRALWFLDRLAPGNTAYVIGGAARVLGGLDAEALVRALHRLGERHPALRSTFQAGEAGPVQRVHEVPAVEVVEEDGGGWSSGEGRERLRERAFRPFDLEKGPLLRLVLVRNPPETGSLLVALALHHVVSDFWSLGVIVRELGALYAQETGWEAALPPAAPAGALAEVARREAARLGSPEGERLWEFWRGEVSEYPLVLDLPADRPRPAAQTYGGAARHLRLDGRTLAGIQALARERGATAYVALLAGFSALLARLSGQERLLVGSPTAGRGARETELVGYFVNPLPIACDVTGEPSFGELVGRLRGRVLAAFAHQEMPFPLLAERLQPERDTSRPPVFQVMFVLQKERPGEAGLGGFAVGSESRLRLGGLELASLALAPPGSPFDLSLTLADVDGGLAGRLVYNPDLFDAATVARLAGHFSALLSGAVASPGEPVWRLPLLAAAERHQLLVEWNEAQALAAGGDWIADLWGAAVARDPEAVAVAADEKLWTRGDLEARANRLAHRLMALGAGPERLVGVLLERSFEMVVGLMAVLKAGAGYLPLDPELPDERIGVLLREAAPVALLTGSGLAERAAFSGPVVEVDREDLSGWSAAPPALPAGAQEPESVAYVLFTSGSTGVPKGVAVSRRALENLLRLRAADFGESYWALHKAGIGFDVSVIELFAPLAGGGRIVLARPGGQRDVGYLIRLIAEQGAVTAGFPPALLAELLEHEGLERCTSLRRLASGTDVFLPELAGRFSARLPECGLYNCYGPTETTVYVLEHRCGASEPGPRVPIGRPIPGAEVHLLDGRLEPVPAGVPGELCIGGVCLARGYLGRPDLTAERFTPHPFGSAGSRLYRTGDLARRRADGALEFLGRLDRQVKVRGFRVEPGEVEAVLAAHPAVAEAAVVVREGGAGSRDLVAFVVLRAEAPAADLRPDLHGHLTARLPAYMVPSAIELLPALPLAGVGKVDRRELARRAAGLAVAGAAYEAPRTAVEELLAGIWGELLGVARAGRQDGFFDLGGHSLLATRLVLRVRRAFGVELALRTVFEAPGLAGMAAAVEAALRAGGGAADQPITALPRPAGGRVELPASFAQERLWFLARLDPGPSYNLPALLRLRGELAVPALAAALAAVVRRHEALRTVFAERDGREEGERGIVQVIAAEPGSGLPAVDLEGLAPGVREAELRRLADEEARRPFDLAAGPLLRALLVRLETGDHALLLTLHHAVADGWSVGILARELGVLYRAARRQGMAALPALPVQYGDYAVWQRRRLARGRHEEGAAEPDALAPSLAWWRQRLAGAPAVLDLPGDRPRPPVRSLRGGQVRVALPAGLTARLAGVCRGGGATPFMTVLAGFGTLLARCGAGGDLPIGAPVSGRTRAEIEGVVGLFVNTLVLRLAWTPESPFEDLLAGAREVVLGAQAHQEVPFERLVQEIAPDRDLSRNPLFQVMLAWEGFSLLPGGAPLADGLAAELVPVDTGIAKLDLALALGEKAGPGGATLGGFLEFNRDLFDPATARRLVESLAVLLDEAASDPRRPAGELPLLPPGARHQLLAEWNDRSGEPASAGSAICFHDLFLRQAARRPEAIALVDERETVTFADLARRARRIANGLARLGVGPEVPVGLCAGRSAAAVAGVLGILAAGGVYVPLDPGYPAERLAYLIGDAGVGLILAEDDQLPLLAALLESHPGVQRRALEAVGEEEPESVRQASLPAAPDNLAYVIYTSGSTGTPKGVGVTHRTAASLGPGLQRILGLGPADRVLQFAPWSFDASIAELAVAWAAGAALHLAGRESLLPGEPLAGLLGRRGITAVTLPPTALAALPPGPYPDLALLAVAGEACPAELAERWMPGRRFVNAYGPTETTVCASAGPQAAGTGPLTLGRPLPGLRVHLLDVWRQWSQGSQGSQPVPPGVLGEIYVGGALARGYLGRPAATAERFVPDPFAGEPGARLYRTGDLGRVLPGGEVVFAGRADRQVKVRGFRIEPGEIEEALAGHPAVRDTAVIVDEALPGDLRLVAYAAGPGLAAAGAGALRDHLRRRLPEHLVPARFVLLETLPLTPSGKVDRGALAALRSEAQPAREPAPPQTEVEQMLAEMWSEVLGLDRQAAVLGIHDDFFDLGGHSLNATQVLRRIKETLGVEVPVRRFFAAPTIAELAVAVAEELIAGVAEGERNEILAGLS